MVMVIKTIKHNGDDEYDNNDAGGDDDVYDDDDDHKAVKTRTIECTK
jgi:hypothetical protein